MRTIDCIDRMIDAFQSGERPADLSEPLRLSMRQMMASDEGMDAFEPVYNYMHLSYADRQATTDCAGWGTFNAVECLIHRELDIHVSLDGNRAWRAAKDMLGDPYEGGLRMEDVLNVLVEEEVLPHGCYSPVPMRRDAVFAALKSGPLICGHTVHDGWKTRNLAPENAAIAECYQYILGLNGHLTIAVDGLMHNGRLMMQNFNSWGTDYGNNGLFAMTWNHWVATQIRDPIAVAVRDGWFAENGAWKEWQIDG